MPSLAYVLSHHGPALVLDAASGSIQVGLLGAGPRAVWQRPTGDAGIALFVGTAAVLAEARLTVAELGTFIFCEGPGSMLGIRTTAMAIRTWQAMKPRPAFAYQSLAVAAHAAWRGAAPRGFAVIADARRDSWHLQAIDTTGRLFPLRRVPTSALPTDELLQPENFRTWSALPRPLATCPYEVAAMFGALDEGDFFRPVEAPDAFQAEPSEYKKWSATIHSAASAPRR